MPNLDRTPPQAIEAEQSVLAAMLISHDACLAVKSELKATDFYRPSHQEIFATMVSMANAGKAIDTITLQEELKTRGKLSECGGTEYLMSITAGLPSASRAMHYARIVLNKSMLRQQLALHYQGIERCLSAESYEDCLHETTEQLLSIHTHTGSAKFTSLQDAMSAELENIEECIKRKGEIIGPRTGLAKPDRITLGMDPGLTFIAAATGIGKTSLLLQIPVASRELKGAMYSLEMDDTQLAGRMLVGRAGVDSYLVRSGLVSDDELRRILHAASDLQDVYLSIYDQPCDIGEIMALSHLCIAREKINYILIDYLGLIEPKKGVRSESRNLELGAMARGLKDLSRTYKVPVIVAAQLSRRWQDREIKRPTLRDLRDSGELECHADRVIFIHDPNGMPERGKESDPRKVEIDVAKNRYGPAGVICEVMWEPKHFRFRDIDTEHAEPETYRRPYTEEE